MLRLIRFLFTGDWHLHEWVEVKTIKRANRSNQTCGLIYVSKCKYCGKIRSTSIE